MKFAECASSRSNCLRTKVGCVIVKDRQVLATGYNGPPSGVPECLDPRCMVCKGEGSVLSAVCGYNTLTKVCPSCNGVGLILTGMTVQHCLRTRNKVAHGSDSCNNCRGVHAEVNSVLQAAKHGVSIKDGILYCTHKPCYSCSKMAINAGIKKVFYKEEYPDPDNHEMLQYLEYIKYNIS